MKTTILFLGTILNAALCYSQNDTTIIDWSHCFGGGFYDNIATMKKTQDGGFICGGVSMSLDKDITLPYSDRTLINAAKGNCLVVKLNANGEKQWATTIGGTEMDMCLSLVATEDGGCIFVGLTTSSLINGHSSGLHERKKGVIGDIINDNIPGIPVVTMPDILAVRIDSKGNIRWQKCYGGTGRETANSITSCKDGSYLIAGTTTSNDGDITNNPHYNKKNPSEEILILKINGNGDILDKHTFGGTNVDAPVNIIETSDNGYLLLASTKSSDGDVHCDASIRGSQNLWAVKFDEGWNIRHQLCWGGSADDIPTSILETSNSYFVTCNSNSSNGFVGKNFNKDGSYDGWVLKLDRSLSVVTQNNFGGVGGDLLNKSSTTGDGGFIVSGITNSSDIKGFHESKEQPTKCDQTIIQSNSGMQQFISGDAWVTKFNSNGMLEWEQCFGGSARDYAFDIAETSPGNYAFAGGTFSNDGDVKEHYVSTKSTDSDDPEDCFYLGSADFWVAKFSEQAQECTLTESDLVEITTPKTITLDSKVGQVISSFQVHKGDYVYIGVTGKVFVGTYKADNGQIKEVLGEPSGDDLQLILSPKFKKITENYGFGQVLAIIDKDTIPMKIFDMQGHDCPEWADETYWKNKFGNERLNYFISNSNGNVKFIINEMDLNDNHGNYELEIFKISKSQHLNRNCFNYCPKKMPDFIDLYWFDSEKMKWDNPLDQIVDVPAQKCYHCGFTDFRGIPGQKRELKGCQCVYSDLKLLVNYSSQENCLGTFDYGYWKDPNDLRLHFIMDIAPHWLYNVRDKEIYNKISDSNLY